MWMDGDPWHPSIPFPSIPIPSHPIHPYGTYLRHSTRHRQARRQVPYRLPSLLQSRPSFSSEQTHRHPNYEMDNRPANTTSHRLLHAYILPAYAYFGSGQHDAAPARCVHQVAAALPVHSPYRRTRGKTEAPKIPADHSRTNSRTYDVHRRQTNPLSPP